MRRSGKAGGCRMKILDYCPCRLQEIFSLKADGQLLDCGFITCIRLKALSLAD